MKKGKGLFKNLGSVIIIAMIIGIIVGAIMGDSAGIFRPIGDLFVQLIRMVVIPLVAVSIISGAASLGNGKSAGKIGISTFAFYLGTTAIAVILGLIAGEIFKPGVGISVDSINSMFSNEYVDQGALPTFWETLIGIVPANPIKAIVDGNILQILFFSLFLGFGISSLKEERKAYLVNFLDALNDALIFIILKIMYIAPIGVFALMADATGTFGFSILVLVLKLFIVYVVVLIIHTFGIYALALKFFSKISPLHFFKKIYKVQAVALSTSSSMATLGVNMETCEEELGVSKETASFVLPLGATINMDGNAIYYALAACFFAQLFGVPLGMPQYIAIIITATIGSIGQAGVPGPSLLVVAVLLAANIPVLGLPLLFGVDRLFDMLRTAVNVTGDATCAVIVDKFKD
ncbi:dicarboxylate/amino acid:cation symporter [Cellulosilyticum sp. I15G10I2]|uniref:dicarboxylate/amino acid:cation symporter n=1 Tax=Cellulosilyticum sp. I15G10I2 TaxID=1892843 RepID=UPI00085BE76B|nr:dicarboxylate/amino acid:cation symporter [Cellulosilyticum sp. I15G10I2]